MDTTSNQINIIYEFEEINKLSKLFDNLFVNYSTNLDENNINNPIEFNYAFKKEFATGKIEYKRTLTSYIINEKKDKLIRQIYCRIYEGLITDNIGLCYYLIGIEDSGKPSFINDTELKESIKFIKNNIEYTDIKFVLIFLKNTIKNYKFVVIKFWIESINKIEYF